MSSGTKSLAGNLIQVYYYLNESAYNNALYRIQQNLSSESWMKDF